MWEQDYSNRPPGDFSNFNGPSNSNARRISNRTLAKLSVVLHGIIFLGAALLLFIYFHHASESFQNFTSPAFGENAREGGNFYRQVAGNGEAESQIRPLIEPLFLVFFSWALGLALHFLAVFALMVPHGTRPQEAGPNANNFEPGPFYPAHPQTQPPHPSQNFYPPYQQIPSNTYSYPYQFDRFGRGPGQLVPDSFEKKSAAEPGWPAPSEKEQKGQDKKLPVTSIFNLPNLGD